MTVTYFDGEVTIDHPVPTAAILRKLRASLFKRKLRLHPDGDYKLRVTLAQAHGLWSSAIYDRGWGRIFEQSSPSQLASLEGFAIVCPEMTTVIFEMEP